MDFGVHRAISAAIRQRRWARMEPQRLDGSQIADLLRDWPGGTADLALELRDFVLRVAPEVAETIAFHALCYYKPGRPYGVIGGNVCMIGPGEDCLHLGFIHGASLPDPEGLLQGTGKASRHIEVRGPRDIRRRAFRKIIEAAIAYDPAEA
jgi:hypothetical protein